MNYPLYVFLVSLVAGFTTLYFYKHFNEMRGWAIGIDINKKDQRKICESTGITLIVPIWLATIYLIVVGGLSQHLIAWALLVTGFAIIGFVDDTRNKFLKKATPWILRALPVAAFSLVFAYFFSLDVLWVVPIALFIAVIASFQNTFAGLNGWEVGSGFIIIGAACIAIGASRLFWICLILAGAILALLLWNKYPAKVFPGDSGTLLIGSGIAGILVLTQNYTVMLLGLLFFLPHMVDFALKIISNPKDPSQSKIRPYKVLEDGRLGIPDYKDGKIRYDFAKLLLRIFGPLREWQLVFIIWLVVAANCLVWLFIFGKI